MQKILFRPICHMSHEEANTIFEEIRFTTPYHQMYQGGSQIQKDF
jgi:hypothetical protein